MAHTSVVVEADIGSLIKPTRKFARYYYAFARQCLQLARFDVHRDAAIRLNNWGQTELVIDGLERFTKVVTALASFPLGG